MVINSGKDQNKKTADCEVGNLVLAFYSFSPVTNQKELVAQLKHLTSRLQLKGTVIVASEGINGSLAGKRVAVRQFVSYLKENWTSDKLRTNCTVSATVPFKKLMIKNKQEIVTLKQGAVGCTKTGTLVEPEAWDQLLTDKSIQLIDVRNNYETAIGKFPNASEPATAHFSEFPAYVERRLNKKQKIAMYCTGGIRCEKASSYLLAKGYKQVYQLRGGILNYLTKVPRQQQSWCGKCFVFDSRQEVDKTAHFLDATK